MSRSTLFLLTLAILLGVSPGLAQQGARPVDVTKVLKGVEDRYNSTKTLRADFTQTYRSQGRTRAPEKGVVYLSKPERTRWEYSIPAGRVFLSDGKFVHNYDPQDNTYQREPMKETEDMRIPLSFLLGKLDFQKDFDKFQSHPEGESAVITAIPKNDKLWFTNITMVIAPDYTIRKVTVVDQSLSTMEFVLANEQRNIPVADSLFRYAPPAGAKIVDVGQ